MQPDNKSIQEIPKKEPIKDFKGISGNKKPREPPRDSIVTNRTGNRSDKFTKVNAILMIDYVKIINLSIGSEIQNLLPFEIKVNQETGEQLTNKKKSANLKNMIFTLTPGDRFAKVGGSLHKFANNGEVNNDRFTGEKFRQVFNELSRYISNDDLINVIEFGVNIITPFDPTKFIKNLISHKQTQFNKDIKPGMAYAQAEYTHYLIKIYNKGLQQSTGSYILRVEVKYLKMQKLFKNGLKWSQLRDLDTWENLGKVLADKFSEVIYYDPSIILDLLPDKERAIIKQGHNPIYWQNNNSPHASRDRKQFQSLINKHGTIFNLLPELLDHEVKELVKSYHYITPDIKTESDPYLNPLVKSSPLLYGNDSPTHKTAHFNHLCKVTGIDISMQRRGSQFLCDSGIRFLFKNDPETFDKLKTERLSPKWQNEPINVQFREIAHSIRNEFNNPRHNATRDIKNLYSHPVLFDFVPFIRPDKMRIAGLCR
jgi:hypothetical protein